MTSQKNQASLIDEETKQDKVESGVVSNIAEPEVESVDVVKPKVNENEDNFETTSLSQDKNEGIEKSETTCNDESKSQSTDNAT